jgi:hypothetical protein
LANCGRLQGCREYGTSDKLIHVSCPVNPTIVHQRQFGGASINMLAFGFKSFLFLGDGDMACASVVGSVFLGISLRDLRA